MKQRLLLALLMVFASVGLIGAQSIKVTPNGTQTTKITCAGSTPTISTPITGVAISGNVVTIDVSVTQEVTISTPMVTGFTIEGNFDKVVIEGKTLATSLSFASGNYCKDLTVSGSGFKTLTLSGLGLEALNVLGATALGTLDASNNSLSNIGNTFASSLTSLDLSENNISGKKTFSSMPSLTTLNVSDNQLEDIDISGLASLTTLNVSDNQLEDIDISGLASLTSLDVRGNNIKGTIAGAPTDTQYGTQVLDGSSLSATANKGFRVSEIAKTALSLTSVDDSKLSAISWKKLNGTVYGPNNTTEADQQDTYKDEYRFHDAAGYYVDGTYAVTFTYDGRTYEVQGLKVTPAEFKLKAEVPANASLFTVSGQKSGDLQAGAVVEQGKDLTFSVAPKDGYNADATVYEVENMVPTNSGAQAPYVGKTYQFTVKGKYVNESTSAEPKIKATVKGYEHKVQYENTLQDGGSFTVEKEVGGVTSALKAGSIITTGDKLVIKIKPETGYEDDFKLTINGVNKTSDVKQEDNTHNFVYTETMNETSYTGTTSINIVVTFEKTDVQLSATVDGKIIDANLGGFLKDNQIIIKGQDGDQATYTLSNNKISLAPKTSYQATFELGQAGSDIYRLQDITINGGKKGTLNEDLQDNGNMKYTVAFSVETSDVTLSITTKKLKEVTINVPTGQELAYTGQANPIQFTTTPAGLEKNVKVTYYTNNGSGDQELGEQAPVNAGKYKAKLEYKEDGSYTGKATNDIPFEIVKADLTIETLPTVTVGRDGKYVIEGGKVVFGSTEIEGTWQANSDGNSVNEPDAVNKGKSHTEWVKFTPTSATDKANFTETKAQVKVIVNGQALTEYSFGVDGTLPTGYALTWYNGKKEVNPATDKFPEGTTLTAVLTYPKGTQNVEFKATSPNAKSTVTKDNTASTDGRAVYTVKLNENTKFVVTADAGKQYTVKFDKVDVDYTGEPQAYDESEITIYDAEKGDVTSTMLSKAEISYKGVEGEPIDAGTYTVVVTIPADATTGYVETIAEEAVFTIDPIPAVVDKWPIASVIAKGVELVNSELTEGVSRIPGKFEWKNTAKTFDKAGEYKEVVTFTPDPEYQKNYTSIETPVGTSDTSGEGEDKDDHRVTVRVSDEQIVMFVQPAEGLLVVTNEAGETLKTGDPISKGQVLHITAAPYSNFELASLTVNGTPCSGTYTVGDVSITVKATFSVKEPDPEEIIDPNTQYIVTLPDANDVRGAIINNPGKNGVKFNEPFTFSISTLAADAKNLVVKANGATLTPTSAGTYRLSSVTGNTTITVSLANPTELKVNIPREYKNAKGYLVGKVQVEGPADGKCYYGDALTLVAYPESGVSFTRWSDGNREQLREITVTKDLELKAEFSGTPTGIEDIESASIYAGDGYIQVKNVVNADLTVVSISGRIQTRQHLDGDMQVRVPAGVYVVILESGQEVKRMKVIVR